MLNIVYIIDLCKLKYSIVSSRLVLSGRIVWQPSEVVGGQAELQNVKKCRFYCVKTVSGSQTCVPWPEIAMGYCAFSWLPLCATLFRTGLTIFILYVNSS